MLQLLVSVDQDDNEIFLEKVDVVDASEIAEVHKKEEVPKRWR